MPSHKATVSPPADRIVLFVADGLRADKLFDKRSDGTEYAPFLRLVAKFCDKLDSFRLH